MRFAPRRERIGRWNAHRVRRVDEAPAAPVAARKRGLVRSGCGVDGIEPREPGILQVLVLRRLGALQKGAGLVPVGRVERREPTRRARFQVIEVEPADGTPVVGAVDERRGEGRQVEARHVHGVECAARVAGSQLGDDFRCGEPARPRPRIAGQSREVEARLPDPGHHAIERVLASSNRLNGDPGACLGHAGRGGWVRGHGEDRDDVQEDGVERGERPEKHGATHGEAVPGIVGYDGGDVQ